MKPWSIAIAIAVLVCAAARTLASEVLRVGNSLQVIAISSDRGHGWQIGNRVCVYQARRVVECGEVVKLTKFGAIVRLDAPNSFIARGDMIRSERAARVDRMAAAEESGESGEERRERRKPAAQLLESQTQVEGMQTPTFNLSAGISAGFTYFFPMIHFQAMVTPYVSLGLMPLYTKTSAENSSVSVIGGHVTLSYYGAEYFRGFWGQLAGGVYHVSSSALTIAGTVDEQANCPAIIATVGWRGYWDLGMNVGVSGGIQYLVDPSFEATEIRAANIQPIFQLDVGLSF